MKLIRSLMGRRQFLLGTFMASASALLYKKLSNAFNPGYEKGVAMASPGPESTGEKGVFSSRYSHLLSPLKIGNVVLKNRMMHTQSLPHFFQGPETFPSDQVIAHYSSVARNGAAIVTCWSADTTPVSGGELRNRKELHGDSAHMPMWDAADPSVQNYMSQLTDAIHFYGSLASIGLRVSAPAGYTISNVPIPRRMLGLDTRPEATAKEIPEELIQEMIDNAVKEARFYQTLGFDVVNIHMSYRSCILAHALSSKLNKRTDKYGGSVENRARLPLELFKAFKKGCGEDFLVAAHISGEEMGGGYGIKEAVEFAKIWEPALDILQLRAEDGDAAHPTGLNSEKGNPQTLDYARAIKEGGSKMITAPVGGFQDLDFNEEYVATGKTDMVAMARAWIADPEYGKKAYEGRGEDVVPCVLCNDCHGIGMEGPWLNFCTVNPKMGIAHKLDRMIDPPPVSRKVAVIGGGPAGMKAAVVAAERGHRVTLYEKNDFLGGQLRHTEFASFKWPLKGFKDYLIRQTRKAGVEVNLMTNATPEMIKGKEYDVIILANGAEPIIPDIPGADGPNVRPPIFVFGDEKSMGKNVVVIGGDQIGTETGIYLAENGHNVTILTDEKALATDANQIHYIGALRNRWEALDNFSCITEATARSISSDKVIYTDAGGSEKTVRADDVVIYAGRKPRQDEAMKFYGAADRYFIIGDCHEEGNVRKSQRTAFAAASRI